MASHIVFLKWIHWRGSWTNLGGIFLLLFVGFTQMQIINVGYKIVVICVWDVNAVYNL